MMRRLFAALLMTLPALSAQAAHHQPRLDDTERAIAAWVDANVAGLEAMLEESVNINSGTMNHAGVRKVGEQLVPGLEALGFETRWVDMPAEVNRAGHLFAELDGDRGAKILAIGHLDTVFEPDDAFQAYVLEAGRIAHGPGVEDMKSGNLIILYALRALDAAGALDGAQIRIALTGDEESPGEPLELVRRDLVEAGKWADIALGFESGIRDVNDDGSITEWATIARRSSSGFTVEVTGIQAHSSGVFSERVGAGAAFEAARILNAFYEEVRGPEYLTFNAGSVLAGTQVDYDEADTRGSVFGKTNVVPSRAIIHGGIRTISNEQLEAARAIRPWRRPTATAGCRACSPRSTWRWAAARCRRSTPRAAARPTSRSLRRTRTAWPAWAPTAAAGTRRASGSSSTRWPSPPSARRS